MRNDLDLALSLLGDLDGIAEIASAALDLDAVVEELFKRLDVEDLVVDGLRAVDDELLGDLGSLCVFLLHMSSSLSLLFSWLSGMESKMPPRNGGLAHPSGQQSGVRTVDGAIVSAFGTERKEVDILRRACGVC